MLEARYVRDVSQQGKSGMYLPATMIQPQPEQVSSRYLSPAVVGTLSERQSACAGAGINPRVPTTMSPTMNSRLIFIPPALSSPLHISVRIGQMISAVLERSTRCKG